MRLQNIVNKSVGSDGITRDDYQMWNRNEDSLIYPDNLINHIKARNYYKVLDSLNKERDIKIENDYCLDLHEERRENEMTNLSKYYRYMLLNDLLQ
jgi:hypothetical protein